MIKELVEKWLSDLEEKAAATPNKVDDFAVKILASILRAFL